MRPTSCLTSTCCCGLIVWRPPLYHHYTRATTTTTTPKNNNNNKRTRVRIIITPGITPPNNDERCSQAVAIHCNTNEVQYYSLLFISSVFVLLARIAIVIIVPERNP